VPDRQEKILIIDDERAIRGSIRAYLEYCGFEVIEAENGRTGLERFQQEQPDLIMADLHMPEIDGLELLERVREISPETSVIVISGSGVIDDVVQALQLGACNYLLKPIHDLSVLLYAVEKALERVRMIRERKRYQERLEEEVVQRTAQLQLHQEHLEELVDERTRDLQREIAERRLAETSLKASEQRFRDFAESASDWLWEMDAELRFSYFSERLQHILGMDLAALIGRKRAELAGEAVMAREPVKWREHLDLLRRHEPFRNFEYGFERRDGAILQVQLSGNPVFDEEGQFTGYRGTGRDVSDLRSTQDKLMQSEKMAALGGLVAGVAHEINTPVGIGVTASTHLQECIRHFEALYRSDRASKQDLEELLEDVREAGEVIHANLQRAIELIQSFKQVAVDQSTQERRRFNLRTYLQEILLSLHPRLKRTSHRVELNCPDDIELDSYPGAVSQILTNLVMNSLIHAFEADEKGALSIDASRVEGGVRLTYADNGRGMSSEQAARVFEPFYTTRRGSGGSGLGMNIVYTLVTDTLGGSIECTTQPGKGVSYQITIP
jgi:PAS domain S-box-containing protein